MNTLQHTTTTERPVHWRGLSICLGEAHRSADAHRTTLDEGYGLVLPFDARETAAHNNTIERP